MADVTKKEAEAIKKLLEAAGIEGERLAKILASITDETKRSKENFSSFKEEFDSIRTAAIRTEQAFENFAAPAEQARIAAEAQLKALENMSGPLNQNVVDTQVWAAELEAINRGHQSHVESLQDELNDTQKLIVKLEQKRDIEKELSEEDEQTLLNAKEHLQYGLDRLNSASALLMSNRELLKISQKQANATAGLADLAEKLSPLSSTGFRDSMLGTVSAIGSFSGALTTIGNQVKMQLNPMNLLGSAFSYITESTAMMVKETDAAQAGFFKATGATAEYDNVIRNVREESAVMGVNIDEAAAAVTDLYTGMTQFSSMTAEAQTNLASFTAEMDQLGVSTQTTVALLDSATMALHMTSDEAIAMSKEITKAAQDLGLPVEKMNADLRAAMPQLAVYGKEAIRVFKGVAAAAKLTGIETGRLLDITGQFDTFEGAAEAVGRLNGVLGGNYLNSLEMVNMTEEERIRALLRTMELSGKSFKDMTKYEQKAVAASIGISDMAEANRLLGQSLASYDEMAAKSDASAASQLAMQEAADRSRDVTEKLTNIMQSMAVAVGPLVDLVNFFAEMILKLDHAMGGFLAPTLLVLGTLFTYFKIQQTAATLATMRDTLMKAANAAAGITEAAAEEGVAASKATTSMWTTISTKAGWSSVAAKFADAGASVKQAVVLGILTTVQKIHNFAKIESNTLTWAGIVAKYAAVVASYALAGATFILGAAIKFAGGPLQLFIGLLLAFGAMIFVSQHSPPLIVGILILAGLVIGLGVAMYYAAPALNAAGAGMFLFGAGVALAGLGVIKMAAGMILMSAATVILAVTLPLMAAGIFLMGAAGSFAAVGVSAFAVSLSLLMFSMTNLAILAPAIVPPMITLAVILSAIALSASLMFLSMAQAGPAMRDIGRGMAEMALAMAKMPLSSAISFMMIAEGLDDIGDTNAAPVLREFGDVMTASMNLDQTHVTNAQKLVDEIVRYTTVAQTAEAQAASNNLMEKLVDIFSTGPTGEGKGGQDIVLVMDPAGTKVIAKAVGVQLNKMHNVIASRS